MLRSVRQGGSQFPFFQHSSNERSEVNLFSSISALFLTVSSSFRLRTQKSAARIISVGEPLSLDFVSCKKIIQTSTKIYQWRLVDISFKITFGLVAGLRRPRWMLFGTMEIWLPPWKVMWKGQGAGLPNCSVWASTSTLSASSFLRMA
jgi:hypothetical protein